MQLIVGHTMMLGPTRYISFKSFTFYNSAANSITYQMELNIERTTHAKLFKCWIKIANNPLPINPSFIPYWVFISSIHHYVKLVMYPNIFHEVLTKSMCSYMSYNNDYYPNRKAISVHKVLNHQKLNAFYLPIYDLCTIRNKCWIGWSVFNTHEITKDEKPICTNFIVNIWFG